MAKKLTMTKDKPKSGAETTESQDVFEREVYEDPFDEGSYECASALIWQPRQGESLVGRYDGAAPFTEGTLDTECQKHFILQYGSGRRYSFVGGTSLDKIFADNKENIVRGTIVKITYMGQKKIAKGNVNLWDVKYKKDS